MTASSSGRVRAVIVDDAPAARRGVRLLLGKEPAIAIVGEAANGDSAVALIQREKPDLVFLDVQMPGADGFEVLRRVGLGTVPAVVFITAYDEHALRAFDVQAVDDLLKPYEDARFREAVARARSELRRGEEGMLHERLERLLRYYEAHRSMETAPRTGGFSNRIFVKSAGEIFFLKPEEIDWIEAEGDYMKFHVAGKAHLMRETMARLEARLDPQGFVRIHRSTIVNIDRVRKLTPSFVGEYAVILDDGTKLSSAAGTRIGSNRSSATGKEREPVGPASGTLDVRS